MTTGVSSTVRPKAPEAELSLSHYLQLLLHRKWIVIGVFVIVSVATAIVVDRLPNVYTSETVILVDPQKVPEAYVKATVTGDVRNRLGTLTQQVLSATRLQKIIETYGLYREERQKLAREDVITKMRGDINVALVSSGGSQGALEAFRITYSGRDPRLVATVTNQLASLFIDENLKAREQQATGTTEFLQHQLEDTRKTLESQEAQLRDFRLKHIGEMPEHQVANLTVLGQLQAALQQEGESLNRAEQQRTYLQTMMAQSVPVVDVDNDDDVSLRRSAAPAKKTSTAAAPVSSLSEDRKKLAALLLRYTDKHPDVQKLREQIAEKEAKETASGAVSLNGDDSSTSGPPVPVPPAVEAPPRRASATPITSSNPVLISQLKAVETEIAKHQAEQQRLNKLVASYQSKLEAIPVREQQIADLSRDYEINKTHYTQLLDKQLSAETATQLEIRQKGEQFSVLDLAQPAQRPSSPKRLLIDFAGSIAGLILGIILAIGREFIGASITSPEQVPLTNGNQVLEVIPMIVTENERRRRKKRMMLAAVSGVAATLALGAVFFHYR